MDWFRSWHGAPTDTAFLVIARRAQVAPGMVSAVYWALLDYASQNNPRGSIAGFDTEAYAEWAGWEEPQVIAIIAAFQTKGKITEGGEITAWNDRQPKREDDSKQRVAEHRWRERERELQAQIEALQVNVTHGNAVSQNVTLDKIREEKIRGDTETETEVPPARPNAPAQTPATSASPSKPSRSVPPGSQPDMFGAIADVCQLDANIKRGQIARMAKTLLGAGYTPEQVRAFPSWWKSHDWRAKNTPVPTMQHIQELIKQSTQNGTAPDDEDPESYEALKRRYVPAEYEDIISY